MFRQLLPTPLPDVDLTQVYAGTDYLRANMVSSLDGAAAVDGRVGGLTGKVDQQVLLTLRELAEVLLVGAGTVRAEGYKAIRGVQLAIVTDSGNLDLSSYADVPEDQQPWVITHAAAPVEHLQGQARIVITGDDRVDLTRAVSELRTAGYRRILTEGGPKLLADLVAADLLTEMCLTISPQFAGGVGKRITDHPGLLPDHRWQLAGLLEAESELFTRYERIDD